MPTSCAEIESETAVDEIDAEPFVHVLAVAGKPPLPKTRAVRSVFELPNADGLRLSRRGRHPEPEPAQVRLAAIAREPGITRCQGAAYPVRWTPEDEERERKRRAKQRPPRPPKRAKTKGKKLRDLIGSAYDFDD